MGKFEKKKQEYVSAVDAEIERVKYDTNESWSTIEYNSTVINTDDLIRSAEKEDKEKIETIEGIKEYLKGCESSSKLRLYMAALESISCQTQSSMSIREQKLYAGGHFNVQTNPYYALRVKKDVIKTAERTIKNIEKNQKKTLAGIKKSVKGEKVSASLKFYEDQMSQIITLVQQGASIELLMQDEAIYSQGGNTY